MSNKLFALLTLPYIAYDATRYGVCANPNTIFGTLLNRQAACIYGLDAIHSVFRENLECIGRRIGIEEPVHDRTFSRL